MNWVVTAFHFLSVFFTFRQRSHKPQSGYCFVCCNELFLLSGLCEYAVLYLAAHPHHSTFQRCLWPTLNPLSSLKETRYKGLGAGEWIFTHAAGESLKMLTGLRKTGEIITKSRQRVGYAPLPSWVQRRRDMFVWFWPIYSGKCMRESIFMMQIFLFFFKLDCSLIHCHFNVSQQLIHFILFHVALKIQINMMLISTCYIMNLECNMFIFNINIQLYFSSINNLYESFRPLMYGSTLHFDYELAWRY